MSNSQSIKAIKINKPIKKTRKHQRNHDGLLDKMKSQLVPSSIITSISQISEITIQQIMNMKFSEGVTLDIAQSLAMKQTQ